MKWAVLLALATATSAVAQPMCQYPSPPECPNPTPRAGYQAPRSKGCGPPQMQSAIAQGFSAAGKARADFRPACEAYAACVGQCNLGAPQAEEKCAEERLSAFQTACLGAYSGQGARRCWYTAIAVEAAAQALEKPGYSSAQSKACECCRPKWKGRISWSLAGFDVQGETFPGPGAGLRTTSLTLERRSSGYALFEAEEVVSGQLSTPGGLLLLTETFIDMVVFARREATSTSNFNGCSQRTLDSTVEEGEMTGENGGSLRGNILLTVLPDSSVVVGLPSGFAASGTRNTISARWETCGGNPERLTGGSEAPTKENVFALGVSTTPFRPDPNTASAPLTYPALATGTSPRFKGSAELLETNSESATYRATGRVYWDIYRELPDGSAPP